MRTRVCCFVLVMIGIGVTAGWHAILAAEEQTKTIKLPNKGSRVIKTRQLSGSEILYYTLAGFKIKNVRGVSTISTVEEFDQEGHFAGANGSFLFHQADGGSLVKTYQAPPNKVSKKGTGTRYPPGNKPGETRLFNELDSDQMDTIDRAIRSLNSELPEENKVSTNGFLIFMALEDTEDTPVAKALVALADRVKDISIKDAAQRLRAVSKEETTELFLEMLGSGNGK